MKNLLFLILFFLTNLAFSQSPSFLQKDSIQSSLDANTQVFYYSKAEGTTAQALVVGLHSWSNTAETQKNLMSNEVHDKNWNFIFPNFRGVNNHPKACCSDFVLSDIDEAIDWALKNMNVDKRRIYVIGHSGGGYATLAMYMKSRHNIRAFSAWVPISDLAAWYGESVERKNRYGPEIIKCTGAGEVFDAEKAKERSPLFWKTPVKKRKKSTLQIYAGIHDGYTGSVPISQSINFYNKLLTDANEKDKSRYVSEEDATTMLKTQTFPTQNPTKTIENRAVLYQKSSKKITLTIFEGTHEILKNAAMELIDKTNK